MLNGNLALWQSVETTDPDRTRHINQRGGFTAIDSYYQIKRATDVFGPIGTGWGYDAEFRFQEGLAIAIVKLWYVHDGKRSEAFPVCATNALASTDKHGKVHLDEDAAKKATTDAITKALSYIGFSADVFEGKFDDNRYVAALKKEKQEAAKPAAKPTPAPEKPLPDDIEAELVRLEAQIAEAEDAEALATVSDGWRSWVTENAATYPAVAKRAAAAKAKKQKEIVATVGTAAP